MPGTAVTAHDETCIWARLAWRRPYDELIVSATTAAPARCGRTFGFQWPVVPQHSGLLEALPQVHQRHRTADCYSNRRGSDKCLDQHLSPSTVSDGRTARSCRSWKKHLRRRAATCSDMVSWLSIWTPRSNTGDESGTLACRIWMLLMLNLPSAVGYQSRSAGFYEHSSWGDSAHPVAYLPRYTVNTWAGVLGRLCTDVACVSYAYEYAVRPWCAMTPNSFEHVDEEQQRPEHRYLRDTADEKTECGQHATVTDLLCVIRQERSDPVGGCRRWCRTRIVSVDAVENSEMCVHVSVCPTVTTLASATLNRLSPNCAWWFDNIILRTSSSDNTIGQQLPVYRASTRNSNANNREQFGTREKNYTQSRF